MNDPLVSIAICTYNGVLHLEEQINSLLNQTYKNIEIIAVDDQSTDHTLKMLKAFAALDSRIKCFSNDSNLGYVKNFEKAVSLCSGAFIALCDQDDIWLEDKIRLQVKNIGAAALIYHDSAFMSEEGQPLESNISSILRMYEGNSSLPFLFYNCISGHSMMMKAGLREKFMPLNKNYFHDWSIAFAAAENGGIKYIDQALVKYRQHENSNTDILKIRKEKIQKNREKFNEIRPDWLRTCYDRTALHKSYIADLISCFTNDRNIKNNSRFKLFFLLIKNYHLLFYLKKKSTLSKLNYIRKMCFRFTF